MSAFAISYLVNNIEELEDTFESRLQSAVNFALSEFSNVRAGRVSAAIIESLTVMYYGNPTRLKELATITNEDSRTLVINPWDVAVRPEVCKALASANVGANPIDNGQYIRMIFPALTEDRRKELVKQVRAIAENGRVTMRNERRDFVSKAQKLAKDLNIGEDELRSVEAGLQKTLNDYIGNLENFLAKKEAEILEI